MPIGVAIIGTGGISIANHLPGFATCPDTRVAALCDASPEALARAKEKTGIGVVETDYRKVIVRDDVQAVVIATPNHVHAEIAIAAARAGKHVLCEKPLAMDVAQTRAMLDAATRHRVRHMTAFTYRFVPAMRYMAHLVRAGAIGTPYHFRAQRFQDWGDRFLGWRQKKETCATGEMGDMLSHRIDYCHLLLGPMKRLVGRTRRFIDRRGRQVADVEDWVSVIADFQNGATGVLESSKLCTGRGEGGRSRDYCEVNGSDGTLVYHLEQPLELMVGKRGGSGLQRVEVPAELLKHPASLRDARAGDPLVVFRYDQNAEFIDAIRSGRDCVPSFVDGLRVQAVMDAVLESDRSEGWVEVGQA